MRPAALFLMAATTFFSNRFSAAISSIIRPESPLNIPLRNVRCESDYVTSQLEIRQNELNLQKQVNQVRVDVQNAVIGLQQARARYVAASEATVFSSQQTF